MVLLSGDMILFFNGMWVNNLFSIYHDASNSEPVFLPSLEERRPLLVRFLFPIRPEDASPHVTSLPEVKLSMTLSLSDADTAVMSLSRSPSDPPSSLIPLDVNGQALTVVAQCLAEGICVRSSEGQ